MYATCPFSWLTAKAHAVRISLISPEGLLGNLASPNLGNKRPGVATGLLQKRIRSPGILHFKYMTQQNPN